MKKTIIIFLILSICVSLFACNRLENDESSSDSDVPKKEGTSIADDSSAEESVAVDESSEIPADPENVPLSQYMSMDKNTVVAYAESLIAMINRNIAEIPEDFFYPKTDNDFPSADDPLFAKMRSNIDYYINTAEKYGVFEYEYIVKVIAEKMQSDSRSFEWAFDEYKTSLENRDYEDARGLLVRVRDYYRQVEDAVASQIILTARTIAQDSMVLMSILTYHPRKYTESVPYNYINNEKNSDWARMAIDWFYGYTSLTGSRGDGYAAAVYPYGMLSVCRYPKPYDEFDDHIVIRTTLPIYLMNLQPTVGQTSIPIDPYDPYGFGVTPSLFLVRPNCAFDSAEILPIDEENEEVTFVLYDENGDEIKRITFNYMTYVFRETYPA